MQIEKYIYRLNRWERAGEKALTERYAHDLPPDFQIRITNPSGIIITGRDKNLTPAQRGDCGFEPGSTQPSYENFLAIVHPDDRSRVDSCFHQAVRERAEYKCHYRIVLPDKSIRDIAAVGRPVLDGSGEPIQFVGTIVDLTEFRRSGEALRAARSDLARMSPIAMLGELSASLAHESNQPFAAIVANSDASLCWQRANPPNLEQSVLAAERIRRDARRASAVVERFRAFRTVGDWESTSLFSDA